MDHCPYCVNMIRSTCDKFNKCMHEHYLQRDVKDMPVFGASDMSPMTLPLIGPGSNYGRAMAEPNELVIGKSDGESAPPSLVMTPREMIVEALPILDWAALFSLEHAELDRLRNKMREYLVKSMNPSRQS